tara:strand:+ start:105 stop:605 length:501 start_codon:yes stop_codon:yes gene_type:complete
MVERFLQRTKDDTKVLEDGSPGQPQRAGQTTSKASTGMPKGYLTANSSFRRVRLLECERCLNAAINVNSSSQLVDLEEQLRSSIERTATILIEALGGSLSPANLHGRGEGEEGDGEKSEETGSTIGTPRDQRRRKSLNKPDLLRKSDSSDKCMQKEVEHKLRKTSR